MKKPTVESLTTALAWYADPETHRARDEDGTAVWPILTDKGQRAREALGLPEPADPYLVPPELVSSESA